MMDLRNIAATTGPLDQIGIHTTGQYLRPRGSYVMPLT